jgi:hypothetical protein
MAEAVRFYWLRREATLPLSAIPEEDCCPPRVCRTVALRHVPDVVKQMEAGRFVAAAWPAAEHISMILCHPNLARGGDGFILDARSLPWLVLRLRDWKEAPEAARLFLSAFGWEAASAEECHDARRQLAGWLEAREQPEMAGAVRRLFQFPLGYPIDLLEAINTWRHVLVKGSEEQIDRFLAEVSTRFEHLGWSRDGRLEGLFNRTPHQVNSFYCWVSGEGAFPRVMLALNQTSPRRVRGGARDVLEGGLSFIDLALEIQGVLTEVLEPAATEAGLAVSYVRVGPTSRIERRTMTALTALADAAEGRWPLTPELEPLWTALMHTAVRDDVAINPDELVAWFVANGWTNEVAGEMRIRFFKDAARISELEEAGRQPA